MTKTQKIVYYVLLAILSIGFLFAAFPKLTGEPISVAGFVKAHLPIWFMYFTGIAEVCGAIGLWIRRLSIWAAGGLMIIMAGAIVTTVLFDNPVMAILPAVFLVLLGIIIWLGKKHSKAGEIPPPSLQNPLPA